MTGSEKKKMLTEIEEMKKRIKELEKEKGIDEILEQSPIKKK